MGALITRCYSEELDTTLDNSINGVETSNSAPVILSEPKGILRGVEYVLSDERPNSMPNVPKNSPIGSLDVFNHQ